MRPAISAEELCGSTSTTRARPLASAVTAASASASVVLPTPPFWLGTATIHGLAILASVIGGAGAVSAAVIPVAPLLPRWPGGRERARSYARALVVPGYDTPDHTKSGTNRL